MKVAILCGGAGLRMHELTERIPKPLASIGGKPMLWHILKTYKHYGFHDFVLLLGYKGEAIKDYFVQDRWRNHSFKLDTAAGTVHVLDKAEDWNITFLDTGADTMTGGRLKRAQPFLEDGPFMLTYGDGLADIDLHKLAEFHGEKKRIATVTGIEQKSQYGTMEVHGGLAMSFREKQSTVGTINGGFFVLEPEVFRYLSGDDACVFEKEPLANLAKDRQLAVYRHGGFWTACDTYRDITEANRLCERGEDKWKVW